MSTLRRIFLSAGLALAAAGAAGFLPVWEVARFAPHEISYHRGTLREAWTAALDQLPSVGAVELMAANASGIAILAVLIAATFYLAYRLLLLSERFTRKRRGFSVPLR